ncbi:OmpA family protein [Pararhodonellum marinum]|uniref:OmpA family protein n=1 Tax=Pararhodonellum marinum TaxID=2755358 RepID=UPI00188DE33C|nr:OmpA family protein [Pararhodonellum marinum]
MKKIFTVLAAFIFISLFSSPLLAQNAMLRYADKQYGMNNFKESSEIYVEAFEKRARYATAKKAAEAFQMLKDYEKAHEWWKKTVEFEESTNEDYANYLNAVKQMGNLEELREAVSPGKSQLDGSLLSAFDVNRLQNWYDNPKNVELIPLDTINSAFSDFGLAMDNDKQKYFTSDRGDAAGSTKPWIRIDGNNKFSKNKYDWTGRDYLITYKQGEEGEISEVKSPIPDTFNFSDFYFMKERPIVFYSVTRDVQRVDGKRLKSKNRVNPEMDYGQSQIGYYDFNPEIYYSTVNEAGELVDYNPFPLNKIVEYGLINPYVDEANGRLYFASDMPGGYGGYDLYYVTFDEEMTFSEPVNLGPSINTLGDERDPFPYEGKFYFSSTGHPGLGGYDIFVADESSGAYSNVTNMGMPINSPQDDFAFKWARDGKRYLSSDRFEGKGLDDIYSVEDLYKKFIARIIDCDGNIISEDFLTTLRERDQTEEIETLRGENGEIMADIAPETDFYLEVKRKGYFTIKDNDLTSIALEGDTLRKDYTLARIPYKLPVFVDLIYYDLDKSFIRNDAKPTLNNLANLMNNYSFLDLMVKSHTDSRASNAYNVALSNRRADAVSDYLSEMGIDKGRVSAEWFGEEKLVNDCGDGVPCPEDDHQLNRRSELVLQAFPDPNVDYEIPEQLMGIDLCDEMAIVEALQDDLGIPTIYFDFDKSFIRFVHKKELERVVLLLTELEGMHLDIEGHTDIRGSEAYNEGLSERRAKVVRDYLIKRGIDENRLNYRWYGKTRPIHDCVEEPCTREMHQLNRRTELRLINKSPRTTSENNLGPVKKSEDDSVESDQEGNFYIVGGMFKKQLNAERFVRMNEGRQFPNLGFVYVEGKKTFYSYVDRLQDSESAEASLVEMKRVNRDFWLLKL